ncbi:hypothetical protein [Polyangium aurulentum]|uniref:hypothetical protein n=1 Tax=Polyangium aurulentum TaxID=2567896 RepID=UPI0010ADE09A|nr:hypothetical protein [Polyangium aurulentum]UQA55113.1 hypothetical protein E8A73_027610 [Polyangium aurulentum]
MAPARGFADHRHAFGAAVQSPRAAQTCERAHASASAWEYDKTAWLDLPKVPVTQIQYVRGAPDVGIWTRRRTALARAHSSASMPESAETTMS